MHCNCNGRGESNTPAPQAAHGKGAALKDGTLSIRQPCPPYCWQNKIVLNHIRNQTPEASMPNGLLVYFVLSELASDEHAAENFRAKHSDMVKKCGLSRRTVITHLQNLARIGVIEIFPDYGPDGRQLPSLIRLHTPDEMREQWGEGATIARGEGANARGGVCTPSLRIKKEVVVSPLIPQGGNTSLPIIPAMEDVKSYATGANIGSGTAERFHAYGKATDWMDKSGKPIGNWKRALLAFAKRDKEPETAPAPAIGTTTPRKASGRKPRPDYFHPDHSKGF